jgi:metal-dependent amidase/aminoacylase/carboxypeptidase family protein
MSHSLADDPTTAIRDATQRIEPVLVEISRDVHAHPEFGFKEVPTADAVTRELMWLGTRHETGIGRTGVVGLIEGGRPGPVLAIRADMDVLPIEARSGSSYQPDERCIGFGVQALSRATLELLA